MPTRVLILCLLVAVGATSLSSQKSDSLEAELRAAMTERLEASVAGDTDKIAPLISDDYLQTDISGYVQDKPTWLKEYFKPLATLIKAGKFHWEVFEQKDLKVRTNGDVAVIVGKLYLKGNGARWVPDQHTWMADQKAGFTGTLSFTHVWVRRNGNWLLVALHNSVPFAPPVPK